MPRGQVFSRANGGGRLSTYPVIVLRVPSPSGQVRDASHCTLASHVRPACSVRADSRTLHPSVTLGTAPEFPP